MLSVYEEGAKDSSYEAISTTLIYIPYNQAKDKFNNEFIKINPIKLDTYGYHRDKKGKLLLPNTSDKHFSKFLERYEFKKNYGYPIEYTFRIKNPRKYWWVINAIFSYKAKNCVRINCSNEQFIEYGNYFLRIGNTFLVSPPSLFCKDLEIYNPESTFKFEGHPYDEVISKLETLEKLIHNDEFAFKSNVNEHNDIEHDFKEYSFKLKEILPMSFLNNRSLGDKEAKEFYVIPQTEECNLIKQLYELYSDMLQEFKVFDSSQYISFEEFLECQNERMRLEYGAVLKNYSREHTLKRMWKKEKEKIEYKKNDCDNVWLENNYEFVLARSETIKLTIIDFLQSMKDFFYVSK